MKYWIFSAQTKEKQTCSFVPLKLVTQKLVPFEEMVSIFNVFACSFVNWVELQFYFVSSNFLVNFSKTTLQNIRNVTMYVNVINFCAGNWYSAYQEMNY